MPLELFTPSFIDELVKIAAAGEDDKATVSLERLKQLAKNVAVIGALGGAGALLGGLAGHGVMKKWPSTRKYVPYALPVLGAAGTIGGAAMWNKARSLYEETGKKAEG